MDVPDADLKSGEAPPHGAEAILTGCDFITFFPIFRFRCRTAVSHLPISVIGALSRSCEGTVRLYYVVYCWNGGAVW